jgi:putative MFS transporter
LFLYPRSVFVSCAAQLFYLAGNLSLVMWSTTLLVLVLQISATQASYLMIFVSAAGFIGRFLWSYLSDKIGRRPSAALASFGAALTLVVAGHFSTGHIGALSIFWLLLVAQRLFGDGGNAIVQPYSAEVWPTSLRASGMGFAYGIGNLGKIIGPLGLALIIGASDIVRPEATLDAVEPALLYLAGWYVLAGLVCMCIGLETKGRSLEQIDSALQLASTRVNKPASLAFGRRLLALVRTG